MDGHRPHQSCSMITCTIHTPIESVVGPLQYYVIPTQTTHTLCRRITEKAKHETPKLRASLSCVSKNTLEELSRQYFIHISPLGYNIKHFMRGKTRTSANHKYHTLFQNSTLPGVLQWHRFPWQPCPWFYTKVTMETTAAPSGTCTL